MKNNLIESVVVVLIVVLLVLILNPAQLWMPDMAHMTVVALLLAAFAVYAGFVLRESAVDEREALHRAFAGRAAFLSGSALLLIGILREALLGAVDSWLVIALVAMVLAKFIARFYTDRNG